MLVKAYDALVKELSSIDDVARLASPTVSYNTLTSIFSQAYSEFVRRTAHEHKNRAGEYFARYEGGEDIVSIAEDVNIAPVLLARKILLLHLQQEAARAQAARDGGADAPLVNSTRRHVSACIKDPSLIRDERLRNEIVECNRADEFYAPAADRIKQSIGMEYEFILMEKLRLLGVPFVPEEELRALGYPKTPDVKLVVPIAVDGRVVHWIDSKASFGDRTNLVNAKDQFQSYVNHFGSGMVIYWFDYLEDADVLRTFDAGILLASDFPADPVVLRSAHDRV